MARYAIGDIQGCYSKLSQLISKIGFNPSKDILYLVGDLVNRGPESLEVLKWAYKYQDSIISVLGNHDIYLLARYNNIRKPDEDETIMDVLRYKSVGKLIDWLRSCPLIYHDSDFILAHAGIYPKMDFNKLLFVNRAVTKYLTSPDYALFLHKIFGNKPNIWSDSLESIQQAKFLINSCTRMRYLNLDDYSLDFKFKETVFDQASKLIPWFKVGFDSSINKKIIFKDFLQLIPSIACNNFV